MEFVLLNVYFISANHRAHFETRYRVLHYIYMRKEHMIVVVVINFHLNSVQPCEYILMKALSSIHEEILQRLQIHALTSSSTTLVCKHHDTVVQVVSTTFISPPTAAL